MTVDIFGYPYYIIKLTYLKLERRYLKWKSRQLDKKYLKLVREEQDLLD